MSFVKRLVVKDTICFMIVLVYVYFICLKLVFFLCKTSKDGKKGTQTKSTETIMKDLKRPKRGNK